MRTKQPRRQFLTHLLWGTSGFMIQPALLPWIKNLPSTPTSVDSEPLFDWSLWEKYRTSVEHPCLTFTSENVEIAQKNIQHYDWARNYASNLEKAALQYLHLTEEITLEQLIETTTPGDPLWTPCPACRDQGLPVHPHGLWNWNIGDFDRLECAQCGTIFPHDAYPESVVLHASWGIPQKLTFYGGETFKIFRFNQGRPSFSANIRSRKVQWSAGFARLLAEVYLLTQNPKYAEACRRILLRLAACYPNWLVHEGYGEYADMDPRIAALHIGDLPQPELTPPPNEPDGALWTGYWSAGRASGVGLESDFIRKVVEAYDMTCTATDHNEEPVYTDADRITIERDLLLESTILLVCDKKMNNKSVSNRTAVALVGMCVGHPELFRFGLEGFQKTINEWYLKDGTTSESAFYGLMTLGGIWDFAEASKGYSDPPGFEDSSGHRIDSLNVYHQTGYDQVWQAFFNGLQGDLHYPPYADSFQELGLAVPYVDLMVANYPEKKEYLALLREMCGDDLTQPSGPVHPDWFQDDLETYELMTQVLPYDLARPNSPTSFSLFFRDPDISRVPSPPLQLPDWCPPELRIGHMRTGVDGRESLLLLSASHWGIHHEKDSLHLYYWKNGVEVLSDLGYLWDHPEKWRNIRTLAHNTVLVDEKDQKTRGRGGRIEFFQTSPHVKVMEATSGAYDETRIYRRTSALIDHGSGKNYAVDFFRVDGGEIQDYVFHLSGESYEVKGLSLRNVTEGALYDFTDIRKADRSESWKMTWPVNQGMECRFWGVGTGEEEFFLANGWGQRDWKNSDVGAVLPYVVRRCRGRGVKTFISVIEGSAKVDSFVESVQVIDPQGTIAVTTRDGIDYISSSPEDGTNILTFSREGEEVKGRFIVLSMQEDRLKWKFEV